MSAKDIVIKPITAALARETIKKHHYSGKVVQNSSLHLGVYYNGFLEGALQFGPSLDKSKVIGLVKNTSWNGFIELNRMAFSDNLPRNSESRAIAISMMLIKKNYPHIKWVLSFADATQSGDGTIYRAAGFKLIGINKNKTLYQFPNGAIIANMTLTANSITPAVLKLCDDLGVPRKARSIAEWRELGGKPLEGFQLRYIYFLDKTCENNLAVPVLDYSEIQKRGAAMYKGVRK